MPGQTLARREWDGEGVLFNDLTGATHLLSSTALWLLDRLQAAPAGAATLAAALSAALLAQSEADAAAGAVDTDDTDAVAPHDLHALLHELQKMHLIQPC